MHTHVSVSSIFCVVVCWRSLLTVMRWIRQPSITVEVVCDVIYFNEFMYYLCVYVCVCVCVCV